MKVDKNAVILQLTDLLRVWRTAVAPEASTVAPKTSTVPPEAAAVPPEAPTVDASVSVTVGVFVVAVAVAVGEVAVGVGEALRDTHDAQAPELIWRRIADCERGRGGQWMHPCSFNLQEMVISGSHRSHDPTFQYPSVFKMTHFLLGCCKFQPN